MADHDVPPPEMRRLRPVPDPVDAALRGEPVRDPAVEALVHDLRTAYLPEGDRPRSAALAAFAGPASPAGDPAVAPPRPAPIGTTAAATPGRRARVAVAAFVATLTGKLVLGGAIAAATVGGLHATNVVDVPLLPDVDRPPVTDPTPGGLELPTPDADGDGGDLGSESEDDVGTARTGAPGASDATDETGDDRPGAEPDAVGDSGEAPPGVTPPTTAGPPRPTTTPSHPGPSTAPGGPATTAPPPAADPADAAPPTSATQPQTSRNIP